VQDLDLDRCVVTFRGLRLRVASTQDGGVTDADQPSGNSAGFLMAWKKLTPYSALDNWVFASLRPTGSAPFVADSMLLTTFGQLAEKGGLCRIVGTPSATASLLGQAGAELEETKELIRHANIPNHKRHLWRPFAGRQARSADPSGEVRSMRREKKAARICNLSPTVLFGGVEDSF